MSERADSEVAETGDATAEPSVFISYSRKDGDRMQALAEGLRTAGFRVLLDTTGIRPAEIWRERLAQLIRQCDSVIFLISPDSVRSSVCEWELDEAERRAKRLFPVRIRETADADIPGRLLQLNHIVACQDELLQPALADLVESLRTDISWLREHTVVEEMAQRWRDSDESPARLLRGADIDAVERWRDRRPRTAPNLTEIQKRFIAASRRQVETMARRRAAWTSMAAITAIAVALITNELRVTAGLSAFEAHVSAEAVNIIEGLNSHNESHELARALHAYYVAKQTLPKPPDVVWNALRLALSQHRAESTAAAPAPLRDLAIRDGDGLLGLDTDGTLWTFEAGLDQPRRVAFEQALEDAANYGISPSRRSVWQRRDDTIRFHDLDGRSLALPPDMLIDAEMPFDAVPACAAAVRNGRVFVTASAGEPNIPPLNLKWDVPKSGRLRVLRVSGHCERLLLLGERSAFLYRRDQAGWTPHALEVGADQPWTASPNLRFIIARWSNSLEIARYDAESDGWKYFLPDLGEAGNARAAARNVDEAQVTDTGAFALLVGNDALVFDDAGRQRMRSPGGVLPRTIALSAHGDRLVVYQQANQRLTLFRAGATPLLEPVLDDVALPAGESISALSVCGPSRLFVIGGYAGSVLVLDPRKDFSVIRRLHVSGMVRRIDCDRNGPALIVSDEGLLDIRRGESALPRDELGAVTGTDGAAVFPDDDNGLLIVGPDAVYRRTQDGRVIEKISRAPHDDDTVVVGGNVLWQTDPRRLLLLGQSAGIRNGRYGARVCAYTWGAAEAVQVVCRGWPEAIRFSAGGFVGETTLAGVGIGGQLSLMDLSTPHSLNLDGGPQIVPRRLIALGDERFIVSSLGGELQIWAKSGTLLRSNLDVPGAPEMISMTAEEESHEVLVAADRAIYRTVLSGERLKDRACAALSRINRTDRSKLADCAAVTPESALWRRIRDVPVFTPLHQQTPTATD
ncbi:MAG: hypothetical protein BGP24_03875 [Lysobacterales bacterium 69-70]|nr:toll/interleukin-1 receptor domain-containing protein [Xanthomonadaceae bacterium]ODU32150.1 MAG: hypothetical protein ABS97_18140 [Xanthomonadaceae bacterium SCN 69-320]ODV19010.1 MAG: hypothetical protein ABT27_12285 [Xanthomonadaceae bacterium SCN 69-25]OJZ01872.1 MAG: hypothetical protein BGP24_03875 [Xanthomonadales bacterium 69-70]